MGPILINRTQSLSTELSAYPLDIIDEDDALYSHSRCLYRCGTSRLRPSDYQQVGLDLFHSPINKS